MGEIMLGIKPHHQPAGVPAAGDQAAELGLLGRLRVGMETLRVVKLGEGDDLVRLDRDAAEAMHVAFDIVLEIAVVDGVGKRHAGG